MFWAVKSPSHGIGSVMTVSRIEQQQPLKISCGEDESLPLGA